MPDPTYDFYDVTFAHNKDQIIMIMDSARHFF